MRRHQFAQAALVAAAVVLTGPTGCASWFHRPQLAKVRPISSQAAVPTDMREQLAASDYGRAVDAIARRDYGRALDFLQAARARQPQDVAVLNAFGVVYDKLGRFDLSARYYAQAQAVEPGSEIVHRNQAYSAMLQGLASPSPPTATLAADSPRPAETRTASAPAATPAAALTLAIAPPAPSVLTIARAPAPVALLSVAPNGALITGRPLQIVDATGTADKAEAVRSRLVDQGWSAPKSAVRQGATQLTTLIAYPETSLPAARALARTLPFPVQLAACQDGCQGLSLVVGSDAVIATRSRS